MGMRRRTRRRALIAGAAIAHHEDRKYAQAQPQDAEQPPTEQYQAPPQMAPPVAPPAPDPADEIEHYAQLHESGALTDEEFAAAKAKILGM